MAGGAWPYAPGTSRASIPRTSSALDFDAPSGSGTSAAQALQHNDHKYVWPLLPLTDRYLMSVIRAHVDELFAVSTDPSVISDRLAILEQRVLQSSDVRGTFFVSRSRQISVNLGPLFAVVRAEHSLPRSPLFPDEAVTPSPTHATLPDPYSRSSSAPAESHHQYHYAPHGSMGPPPLSRPHTQPRPRRLQTDIMPSHWTFPPPAPHPRPPSSKRPRAGEEQRYATTPAPARRPRPSLSFGQAARSYPPAGGRVFGLGIPPASATSPTEMNERLQAIEDEYRRAQGANEVEMLEEVPDIGPSSR
ncbi:hypothetical protein Q8F55_008218 [Vanrija albida]|uniref:Uncharacterized protein n=1 Tax=Vanrija albida TaxID=181172 RepID=A0ABR3PVL7_9TREE